MDVRPDLRVGMESTIRWFGVGWGSDWMGDGCRRFKPTAAFACQGDRLRQARALCDCDNNIAFFVAGFDVAMGFRHLFQRIAAVYHRPELSCFNQRFDQL
jgi:hypothetical protein